MRDQSTLRFRPCSLVAAVIVSALLGGCLFKKNHRPDDGGAAAAADERLIERMEKMRTRALNAPGGAMEASDFASQVTLLYSQGVAKRRPIAPTLVDEAVQCLTLAREARPDEAADLLAHKGEMLLAADRQSAAVAALRESIAARPNLRAFNLLVKIQTAARDADVEALCKKTLPAMKSDDSRYAVLDECLKASKAATPETGLRWASSKDIAFYKARRKQLEARLEAAKQKK